MRINSWETNFNFHRTRTTAVESEFGSDMESWRRAISVSTQSLFVEPCLSQTNKNIFRPIRPITHFFFTRHIFFDFPRKESSNCEYLKLISILNYHLHFQQQTILTQIVFYGTFCSFHKTLSQFTFPKQWHGIDYGTY